MELRVHPEIGVGVFAKQDIQPGQVIFQERDAPVILGWKDFNKEFLNNNNNNESSNNGARGVVPPAHEEVTLMPTRSLLMEPCRKVVSLLSRATAAARSDGGERQLTRKMFSELLPYEVELAEAVASHRGGDEELEASCSSGDGKGRIERSSCCLRSCWRKTSGSAEPLI